MDNQPRKINVVPQSCPPGDTHNLIPCTILKLMADLNMEGDGFPPPIDYRCTQVIEDIELEMAAIKFFLAHVTRSFSRRISLIK